MKYLARNLDDLMVFLGCIMILIGVYQVNPLLVWFVGGGMLILGGIVVGLGSQESAK